MSFLTIDRMHTPVGTCLIHQIYGLVGKEASAHKGFAQMHRIFQHILSVLNFMEFLISGFKSFKYLYCLFLIRFLYIHLLETAGEG